MAKKPNKPISRTYAVTSDDDPKNQQPISYAYAVKSDGKKTNTEPVKSLIPL